MKKKPLIFIGSSQESEKIALAVQKNLSGKKILGEIPITVQVWSQGVFGIGDTAFNSLNEIANQSDFAILIFGDDTKANDRGKSIILPRDNVIFELGLFCGIIGGNRTYIIKNSNVKVPSDIYGITYCEVNWDKNDNSELESLMGPASSRIFDKIENIYKKEPEPIHKRSLVNQYINWWDRSNSSRTSTEKIQTFEGLELLVSPSTFSPDVRLTYSPNVVYKRLPKNLSGKKVLDLGTGCGVLAICAAIRGAEKVEAVDISPTAISDTNENVEKLVRDGKIKEGVIFAYESDLFNNVSGKFDYILANLPISAEAKSWDGLPRSVEDIMKKCIKRLDNHLKKKGKAIFAWASFGPPNLIPDLLKQSGFSCETLTEETFGVSWYACVAQKKK